MLPVYGGDGGLEAPGVSALAWKWLNEASFERSLWAIEWPLVWSSVGKDWGTSIAARLRRGVDARCRVTTRLPLHTSAERRVHGALRCVLPS